MESQQRRRPLNFDDLKDRAKDMVEIGLNPCAAFLQVAKIPIPSDIKVVPTLERR